MTITSGGQSAYDEDNQSSTESRQLPEVAYRICQFANGRDGCSCKTNNSRICLSTKQAAESIIHIANWSKTP